LLSKHNEKSIILINILNFLGGGAGRNLLLHICTLRKNTKGAILLDLVLINIVLYSK